MTMKVLIVAATSYEIAPLLTHLDKEAQKLSFFEYQYRGHQIVPLVTGVGTMMTAFAMGRLKGIEEVDIAIHVGIAGAWDTCKYPLGSVVSIERDRLGDLGVEEVDGQFRDVYDMELTDKNAFPYADGWIERSQKIQLSLPKVSGVTVNKVTGEQKSIDALYRAYQPDIETMEGAAFLYVCRMMDMKCVSVRGISNKVEPRNKDNWRIAEAIDAVNSWTVDYLANLEVFGI